MRRNPLLLTGLLLAGAGGAAAATGDAGDGRLTAEELAAFDLRGAEWLVLSGCGTGLGELRRGEGVFGLQRAARLAGARSCVMSLWPVPDDAARDFMETLYRQRLTGSSTIEAMTQATRQALERARRGGGRQGAHPRAWGAFVATGAWD